MFNESVSDNLAKRILPATPKQAFWLALSLCIILSFFIIFILGPLAGISRDFGGEPHDGYLEIARNLIRANGYVFEKAGPPVFHRPPACPLLLMPVTLLPKPLQQSAWIIIQSLMVGGIGYLLFKIAAALFSTKTAGIAVAVLLLNPWLYFNAKYPMTPILQAFLYILLAALLGKELLEILSSSPADDKNKISRPFAIGLVAAAATLTHGVMTAVVFIMFSLLFLTALIKRNYTTAKLTIAAGLIMSLLIAPWTLRNYLTFNRFIPVTRGSGLAYFNGKGHWASTCKNPQRPGENYIDASLRIAGFEKTKEDITHYKGFKNINDDDKMTAKMTEDIRTQQGLFIKKILLNAVEYSFPALTYPFLAVKHITAEKVALTVFHLALWVLAVTGICKAAYRRQSLLPHLLMLLLIILYAVWYFPFATFIGHSLYTLGTIPFLTILAAQGLAGWKTPHYH